MNFNISISRNLVYYNYVILLIVYKYLKDL